MGGYPPLGYDVRARQLVVNQAEAETVRKIFERYLELGSVRLLKQELDRTGICSKRRTAASGRESGGQSFSRGALYNLLSNPLYVGEIRHKDASYPGQHASIIDREIWEKTSQQLGQHSSGFRVRGSGNSPSVLMGKLFDEHGEGLTPTHTNKGQRRYRYYVSRSLLQAGAQKGSGWRVPAAELEGLVALAAKRMLEDKRLLVTTLESSELDAGQLASLLRAAEEQLKQLQSGAQTDAQLSSLIERVELKPQGLRVTIELPVAMAAPSSAAISITHELRVLI
jgi:site-specific DNA recombinase